MKTITLLITAFFLAFSIPSIAQQWTRIDHLPASNFTALEIIDGTVYTASGPKIYYSTDAGEHWLQSTFTNQSVDVICFKKFGSRLYAGTNNGLFSAPSNNLNAWTQHLSSGWISSFAEKDGVLYASAMGIGKGVFKRNADGNWTNFSSGLPSYSLSVNKMLATPVGLLAFAGANGTFYRYNTVTTVWVEDYYGIGPQPALDFEDALLVANSIYVSRFNKVLRSDDFGNHWVADQAGLTSGHGRTMALGANDTYTLTTVFTGDSNFTWLRKRNENAAGTDWGVGAETLNFFAYALAQLNDKVFIASGQGIYVKDAALGTGSPVSSKPEAVVFPNPSHDGRFFIEGSETIDELAVYDTAGKCIVSKQNLPAFCEFQVPGQGLYFVRSISGKDVKTFKVLAKCQR